jgi:PAS domain S-box-containing protein
VNPQPGPQAVQAGAPERAARWQELSENIPVGLYVMRSRPDLSETFLFASRAWLAMVDLELEDLQANPHLAIAAVHPDDREDLRRHNVEALSAGTPFLWHGRLLVRGEVSWVRIQSTPTREADGCLLWEGVMIDISDLKQREQELQQQQQELHHILAHLPIPVGSSRVEGEQRFEYLNRCFSETFGHDLGSVESVADWMRQAYPHPLRRRFYSERWQRDLAAALRGDGRIPARDYRVTCRDGSRRDVWLSAVVLDDLLVAAFLDITERRRAELALALARRRGRRQRRQQQAELERKLQSSLTAAAMVHEIQQPLSTLLIGAQLALASIEQAADPTSAQLRGLLAAQRDQARQLLQTTEKMRTLLRNVQTPHLPVNLSEVVESALLFLRRTLLDAGITVDSRATQAPCWVAGDGAQLQIVVVNLLRNAQQALQAAATVQPHIAVALRRTGEALELAVEDNGPGLPPELVAANALSSGQAGGKGVGLYVVNTTMENHGGSLRLGRSPLGGAAMTLRFPALPTPLDDPPAG